MKGRNELHLNASTMKEAAQMWLDAQFKEGCAPTVDYVSYRASAGGGGQYVLALVENEEPEADAK